MTVGEMGTAVLEMTRTRKFIWSLLFIATFTIILVYQHDHAEEIKAAVFERARLVHSSTSRFWMAKELNRNDGLNELSSKNGGGDAAVDATYSSMAVNKTPVSYAIYAAHTPNGRLIHNS